MTYGHTPVTGFGPLALEAMQARFVDEGLSRSTVSDFVGTIKRMFRWATARETSPVPPVADEVVDATLPHLPAIVADMVRAQRLLGCRPGKVCMMRPCDIDRTAEVWEYRPASHKTEHHGRQRVIFIGPKAQEILLPYLLRDAEDYCFAPADSERKRNAIMRANRKTPVQPSQQNRRKAEHLNKGANPRFVVTSLAAEPYDAKTLYEVEYCGRGEMENRIKEQQRFLFADRTSASSMRANQLRLWFSSVAYALLQALRREGLKGTPMAQAQCDTIRLKLLKIGAQIRVTVRKVWVALAEGCPYEGVFRQVYQNLLAMRPTWVPRRC
jgi:hypothetical protein